MNSQIELHYLVEHCKQLPTYRDALPIVHCIQGWGIDNNALSAASLAIKEIREHFMLTNMPIAESSQKKLPAPEITTPEMPEFRFFHQVSDDMAVEFKELLRNCIAQIDTEGKKEWFCLYAAWRFFQKEREVSGGFVDFFTDIDAMFPGLLKDIKRDDKTNRRFKPYCDMLSYEYKRWAVADGKLPPMQVWTHGDWTKQYNNSWDTIKRMQGLVRQFYMAFAQLFGTK